MTHADQVTNIVSGIVAQFVQSDDILGNADEVSYNIVLEGNPSRFSYLFEQTVLSSDMLPALSIRLVDSKTDALLAHYIVPVAKDAYIAERVSRMVRYIISEKAYDNTPYISPSTRRMLAASAYEVSESAELFARACDRAIAFIASTDDADEADIFGVDGGDLCEQCLAFGERFHTHIGTDFDSYALAYISTRTGGGISLDLEEADNFATAQGLFEVYGPDRDL